MMIIDSSFSSVELWNSKLELLTMQTPVIKTCSFVGHGPFSHMFDTMFIPEARKDYDWKV